MKPLGIPTGASEEVATNQPDDPSRRTFITQVSALLATAALATTASANVPGLSRVVEEAETPQSAAKRVELMKASAFDAWAYSDNPSVPPNVPGPELLSPEFLEKYGITPKGEPIGPFVRTTAIRGVNPTDEIPMSQPVSVDQQISFMFTVFVPKGQKGTVNVTWECDGNVYQTPAGKDPLRIDAHDLGTASSSNGYRLHDTATFPNSGTWEATITMDVETDDQEGSRTIELGSFEVVAQ